MMPRRKPYSFMGDKQDIDCQGDYHPHERHVGSPLRLVGQFIPQREVEIDTKKSSPIMTIGTTVSPA
jgi:hypothetical protein